MITFEREVHSHSGGENQVDDGECEGELLEHGWPKLENDYIEYATDIREGRIV